MKPRRVAPSMPTAGQGRPAVVLFLLLAAATAGADAPAGDTSLQLDLPPADMLTGFGQWDTVLASAVLPGAAIGNPVDVEAPAYELAEGLEVQVVHNRRKFRARAMDWVSERSLAIGQFADFIIGGADSGWHLTVDPRGDDEYQLQWKARFR